MLEIIDDIAEIARTVLQAVLAQELTYPLVEDGEVTILVLFCRYVYIVD